LSGEERMRFHVLLAHLVARLSSALEYEEQGVVPRGYFSDKLGLVVGDLWENPGVRDWWELEKKYFPSSLHRWVAGRKLTGTPGVIAHVAREVPR
jgi:hypothetical protein